MPLDSVFCNCDLAEVKLSEIANLKRMAEASPTGRFRLCLHQTTNAAVQEMIIACPKGTYFRPHRHPAGKSESCHIIDGEMTIVVLDDDGQIEHRASLSSRNPHKSIVFRLNAMKWHIPVMESDFVVYHEVYTGPYDRDQDVQHAAFSPEETDAEAVRDYLFWLTKSGV